MAARVKELKVNGVVRRIDADPDRTLLGVLREDLDPTGTKYGCGEGRCGACTVLVGGRAVRSCLSSVGEVADEPVTTIEGLAGSDGKLHPLQQAFLDHGAMQCGYCTPGMIVNAAGLLEANTDPSEPQIVAAMQGTLCRCGTYPRIVAAIRQAAERMKGGPL